MVRLGDEDGAETLLGPRGVEARVDTAGRPQPADDPLLDGARVDDNETKLRASDKQIAHIWMEIRRGRGQLRAAGVRGGTAADYAGSCG